MNPAPGTSRVLLACVALVLLLSGCQSVPAPDQSLPTRSSILAVDVLFPAPLSRDPSLVQAFFVKGRIDGGPDEIPELIPATFVKWSRAYLLDPEPGTYFLVAVTAALDPPWNQNPIAGVNQTRWAGTSADAVIFSAGLIRRTETVIAPGRVAFMGALRVRNGDRIHAKAVFADVVQKQIAERVRPGATSASGIAGWLKRAWTVDLAKTSFSREWDDRQSFVKNARTDLGDSPWAQALDREINRTKTVIARIPVPNPNSPAPIQPARRARPAKQRTTAPVPKPVSPEPKSTAPELSSPTPQPRTVAAKPQPVAPEPTAAEPHPAIPEPEAATPQFAIAEPMAVPPELLPPRPKPRRFPGLPPDSLLASVEFGMDHDDVRRILGDPDGRINRLTAKAWIPFYSGPDAQLRDWIYEGRGRVVFSLHDGSLEVLDVVYDPNQRK